MQKAFRGNVDACETNQIDCESRPLVILGGAGFIGTRLAGLLTSARVPFLIADLRRSEKFPDFWKECDVRSHERMQELVRGAGAIINLAAEHRDDVCPISRYHDTNVEGAKQVCMAARRTGVQKIIFTSSVAVYGFQAAPVGENGPFAPFNEYGRTKLEAEGIYRAWAAEDATRSLVIVRPTVVFGEGNRANVYNLLRQVASGRFLMTGSGNNVKSMAYVGNVAAFLIHTEKLGPGLHVFNYVDAPDMSVMELTDFIKRCLGKPEKIFRIPKSVALAGGHLMDAVAHFTGRNFSISAIRVHKFCESTQFRAERVAQSGFVRPCSLQEALARTIDFEFGTK